MCEILSEQAAQGGPQDKAEEAERAVKRHKRLLRELATQQVLREHGLRAELAANVSDWSKLICELYEHPSVEKRGAHSSEHLPGRRSSLSCGEVHAREIPVDECQVFAHLPHDEVDESKLADRYTQSGRGTGGDIQKEQGGSEAHSGKASEHVAAVCAREEAESGHGLFLVFWDFGHSEFCLSCSSAVRQTTT